ncbi:MAG TPA: HNH endonuclease [Polyangiales bacterium]|nr:HNH endonuclease [Polyangiales bacterium]
MRELELAKQLSDEALISKLSRCVREDRELSARLLAHLGEVDARQLYRDQGFGSMFDYCVRSLHMSESETDLRIKASRIARQFPNALEMLARGELHMTALRLLAPVLTVSKAYLLKEACFKSKQEVKELIAKHFPLPDVADSMRRLPQPRSTPTLQEPQLAGFAQLNPADRLQLAPQLTISQEPIAVEPSAAPLLASVHSSLAVQPSAAPVLASVHSRFAQNKPAVIVPLSEGRYKVRFTASQSLHDMLKEARDLCCDDVPNGEFATIVERALVLLIAHKKKHRFALTSRPRKQWLPRSGAHVSSKKFDHECISNGPSDGTLHHLREAERKCEQDKPDSRYVVGAERTSAKREESKPDSRYVAGAERTFAKREEGQLDARPHAAERALVEREESKPDSRYVVGAERTSAKREESKPDSRYVTGAERTFAKLEEGQLDARRHAAERALVEREESKPDSRYIPRALRREVYTRDGGACSFVSQTGTKCGSRRDLEFHHIVPFAQGGAMTRENLCLMCRSYNALLAERDYGRDFVKTRIANRQNQTASQRTTELSRDRMQP